MGEKPRLKCEKCGGEGVEGVDVFRFDGETLSDLKMRSWGKHVFHVDCLLERYKFELAARVYAVSDLKKRLEADKEVDAVLLEVFKKGSVSLTENIVIYREGGKYFLKVTDYQKGYWAQVPLDEYKLGVVLRFFKEIAEEEK
jgi:hypothetical protein